MYLFDLILRFFSIALLIVNTGTKFAVSSCSRSRDVEAVSKFKSRSHDVGGVPI